MSAEVVIPEQFGRDEMKGITVGELKNALAGMPDDWPVRVDVGAVLTGNQTAHIHERPWFMDKLKTVPPTERVRITRIVTSGTGKLIIEI